MLGSQDSDAFISEYHSYCGIYMYPPRIIISFESRKLQKGGNFKIIILHRIFVHLNLTLCAYACKSSRIRTHIRTYIHTYVYLWDTQKVRILMMRTLTNKRWCHDRMRKRSAKKRVRILISNKNKKGNRPHSFKSKHFFYKSNLANKEFFFSKAICTKHL